MTKKQFTISKLNNLKNDLSSIVAWIKQTLEINDMLPMKFQDKDIFIPNLKLQKELYEKTITNIEEIIKNFDEINNENDPLANHIIISTYNILSHMGNPHELFDYCMD